MASNLEKENAHTAASRCSKVKYAGGDMCSVGNQIRTRGLCGGGFPGTTLVATHGSDFHAPKGTGVVGVAR